MALPSESRFDAIIVGAGFGGLHMLHKLRCMGLRAVILETGKDVGGTWYWNRYPGARCDVESVAYSYSFAPELDREFRWTERYATQAEILKYLKFVTDRLDLRRDIRFETRVDSATYDDTKHAWTVTTAKGSKLTAQFCIMATGPLSVARLPDIEGRDSFQGEIYHTGNWPDREIDFHGKRVGVIGTGSSGTQLIPVVAEQAKHLTVFMRTPNYTVPARNAPLSDETYKYWLNHRHEIRGRLRNGEITSAGDCFMSADLRASMQRPARDFSAAEQQTIMERRWEVGGALLQSSFADVMLDEQTNAIVAAFQHAKIANIVKNPETARKLTPSGYPFGSKRLCVDTGFYETFNRDNVELVDIKADPIQRVTKSGITTKEGSFDLDVIIYATGFDAMTGALSRIDIRGRGNCALNDVWAAGPRTYLGLMTAGFPNLIAICGPQSPSVFTNIAMSNELQVDIIGDMIAHVLDNGYGSIEATESAQDSWVRHVNELAVPTLFMKANSWYLGANIPGKPRVFLPYAGGVPRYRKTCADIAANGYEGFRFTPRSETAKIVGRIVHRESATAP